MDANKELITKSLKDKFIVLFGRLNFVKLSKNNNTNILNTLMNNNIYTLDYLYKCSNTDVNKEYKLISKDTCKILICYDKKFNSNDKIISFKLSKNINISSNNLKHYKILKNNSYNLTNNIKFKNNFLTSNNNFDKYTTNIKFKSISINKKYNTISIYNYTDSFKLFKTDYFKSEKNNNYINIACKHTNNIKYFSFDNKNNKKNKDVFIKSNMHMQRTLKDFNKNFKQNNVKFIKSFIYFKHQIKSITSKIFETKKHENNLNQFNFKYIKEYNQTYRSSIERIKSIINNFKNKYNNLNNENLLNRIYQKKLSIPEIKKLHYIINCKINSKILSTEFCFYFLSLNCLNSLNKFESTLTNYKVDTFMKFFDSEYNMLFKFELKNYILNNLEFRKFALKKIISNNKIKNKYIKLKENSKIIAKNYIKYRNDHHKVFNNILCIKCKKRPKVIMPPCGHIVFCYKCVNLVKICIKCGNTISSYLRLYRC